MNIPQCFAKDVLPDLMGSAGEQAPRSVLLIKQESKLMLIVVEKTQLVKQHACRVLILCLFFLLFKRHAHW